VPFIVKTFDRVGKIGWLTGQDGHGCRRIGTRDQAERFSCEAEASCAASVMPIFGQFQMFYHVEAIGERTQPLAQS